MDGAPDIDRAAFAPRPVDPDLAEDYFAQIRSFEADRLTSMRRQRNAAFAGAGVCATAVCAMAVALAALVPLKSVEPIVFVEDRSTGIVARNTDLDGATITEAAAMNRFFAAEYVHGREGYVWEEIGIRNDHTAAYSSQDEYARYAAAAKAPGGAPQLYGRRAMVRTVIKSVFVLSDAAEEARRGTMQVRFDRGEIKAGEDVSSFWDEKRGCIRQTPLCQTWSAKIDFERAGGKKLPEGIRNRNPLGWLVTRYEAVGESQ